MRAALNEMLCLIPEHNSCFEYRSFTHCQRTLNNLKIYIYATIYRHWITIKPREP